MLKNQLYRMRDAIDVHRREQGAHPASLDALVEKGYLRKVPEDPFTDSTTTWRIIHADRAPGVMDVKSGAPGPATDGSRLSDW